MEGNNRKSGRPWRWVTAALLGLSLFAGVAQPAEAARFRGRGWGWGGYRAYRMPYGGYSRAYPRYGYGYRGYGYRGAAPRYFYGGAYPYGYGGYYGPMRPGVGLYNYAPPML
jgi:hypothetical protein